MRVTLLFITTIIFMVGVVPDTVVKAQQAQKTISHQGVLLNDNGDPVEDDTYIFSFGIYADSAGGNALWQSDKILDVNDGMFNAQLGSEEPLDLPFDQQYWVGVAIDGGEELSPRMPLSASPYAMHALTVKDSSITTDKIGDGAVTMAKLATTSKFDSVNIGLHRDIGTSPEHLGSITIDAPSSGSVLLFLSGRAIYFGESTTVKIGLGTSEASFDLYDPNSFGMIDGSEEKRYALPFDYMTAVDVEEGTHTIYATAQKSTVHDQHTINLDNLQIIAVYLPE